MNHSQRAYIRFSAALPAAVAFRMDLLLPRLRTPELGPFNGQLKRQEIIRELLAEISFDGIVETGSFRGTTTRFLSAVSGLPVHSAEIEERFYRYAAVKCRAFPRIQLHHGDSRKMLNILSRQAGDPALLFYLDAHWQEDVPRYQELEIIKGCWSRSVVMIDDFQVPGDPGYQFTSYHGVPLNVNYLPELPGWKAYYPASASGDETGAKRGCVVLASPGMTTAVDALSSLRAGELTRQKLMNG
ncbi:hypothetical protein ACFPH6_42330 [Streptomyces xiangluensis]|uniref:Methyltransferase domain-containing protein n=1 Tax=Streptomyces xiangluensis TaxID=2665720 RepID=A0ABV8Z412_9ACTN